MQMKLTIIVEADGKKYDLGPISVTLDKPQHINESICAAINELIPQVNRIGHYLIPNTKDFQTTEVT